MVILENFSIYCFMRIKDKNLHFIGIGGVSISSLACFAKINGANVSGSDIYSIPNAKEFDKYGIKYYVGSNKQYIENADYVIYSTAVKDTDIELSYAKALGKITIPRQEFLSRISEMYDKTIAISGTHGKTTTTSMVTAILNLNNSSFASHIGGVSLDINSNFIHKGNDFFVTEACEYQKNFLALNPTINVVLNVENDHPDTYKSHQDMIDTFNQFIKKSECSIIDNNYDYDICTDDHIITFGFDNNSTYYAGNIKQYDKQKYSFDICSNNKIIVDNIKLSSYGKHNINNALCAGIICILLDIPVRKIKQGLENFKGVKRRFEDKGYLNGAKIITDYAHHPTEIEATIKTAKKIVENKLYVIYEPHTYSRTMALFDDFKVCFTRSDELIMLPTYPAREKPCEGVDAKTLYENIINIDKTYIENYAETKKYLQKNVRANDMVLVLGAGTIEELANDLSK